MSHAIFFSAKSLWQCPHFPLILIAIFSHLFACHGCEFHQAGTSPREVPLRSWGLASHGGLRNWQETNDHIGSFRMLVNPLKKLGKAVY